MASDPAMLADRNGEVMASIDGHGAHERLVIADVSQDRAWIAVPTADARPLDQWR